MLALPFGLTYVLSVLPIPLSTSIRVRGLCGNAILQKRAVGRTLKTSWKMSLDDKPAKDKGGDDGIQMGLLLERMEQLRNQEEELQRTANKNWREGRCSHKWDPLDTILHLQHMFAGPLVCSNNVPPPSLIS